MFLTIMVIGLVGLVMMALPALGGHHLSHMTGHGHAGGAGLGHHAGPPSGHLSAGHAPIAGHGASSGASDSIQLSGTGVAARGAIQVVLPAASHTGRRFIPSPRAVFSLLALYGAFANALVHAAHLTHPTAAVLALGPAFLVEWVLIRPVWNLLFRFRAGPSSPLEELILSEAQAVVPFRNGRGLVTTVRDGRRVQLNARLCDQHAALPVACGQRLRIEDVDARHERVTVSVVSADGLE